MLDVHKVIKYLKPLTDKHKLSISKATTLPSISSDYNTLAMLLENNDLKIDLRLFIKSSNNRWYIENTRAIITIPDSKFANNFIIMGFKNKKYILDNLGLAILMTQKSKININEEAKNEII